MNFGAAIFAILLAAVIATANGDDKGAESAPPSFKWVALPKKMATSDLHMLEITYPGESNVTDRVMLTYHDPLTNGEPRAIISTPQEEASATNTIKVGDHVAIMDTETTERKIEDRTTYRGYLQTERDVFVAFNGRPETMTFTIIFDSKHHKQSIFHAENGIVTAGFKKGSKHIEDLNIMSGTTGAKWTTEALENPEFDHADFERFTAGKKETRSAAGLAKYYDYRIMLLYDADFYYEFGDRLFVVLAEIVNEAQALFYRKHMPVRLNMKIIQTARVVDSFEADVPWVYALSTLSSTISTNADAYAYICYNFHKGGIIGIAWRPGTCSKKYYRTSITEFYRDIDYTARILCHELGHNLGLLHDFNVVKGKAVVRKDKKGRVCTNIGGIMDYDNWWTGWTTCSRQDYIWYYDYLKSKKIKYCLQAVGKPPCVDMYPWCQCFKGNNFWCVFYVIRENCRRMCNWQC